MNCSTVCGRSATLGTPNACNDCHTDKQAAWAASVIERWHGPTRRDLQTFAEALDAAWTDKANAATLLAAVAADGAMPAIARASALTELASRVSPSNINLARRGFANPDPMVRIAALAMLENGPAGQLWPLVAPLLSDQSQGVRIRAASLLAGVPTVSQPAADRDRFERAAAEFIAAQRLNADRPEARSALGSFYARRGQISDAEAEYKSALRLSGQYAPAAINLADLYRQLKRDDDGESVLRAAVAASVGDAGLHHALGLTLIRLGRRADALDELRKAAELAPGQARYAYVYAVGLHSTGRAGDALTVLGESLTRHPDDRDTLRALIGFNRDAGNAAAALAYAEWLARITPNDRDLAGLIEALRHAAKKPDGPPRLNAPTLLRQPAHRASQEGFVELWVAVSHQRNPAFDGSGLCPGPSWISARVRSLLALGEDDPIDGCCDVNTNPASTPWPTQ